MRFRKGYKVEVLSKDDSPSGSWRSAEIFSYKRKTYSVRYDSNSGSIGQSIVVKVPRKVIRPIPPPVGNMKSWTVGDTVEVYNNGSWKVAMISKVIGEVTFMVRPVDSSQEIQVNKLHMRVQQAWEDGTWTVIKKDLVKSKDVDPVQMCVNVTQMNAKVRSEAWDCCLPAKGGVASQVPQPKRKIPAGNVNLSKKLKMKKGAKEGDFFIRGMLHSSAPHSVSSRTLKRKMSYSSSDIEMHAENKKVRVIIGGVTGQEMAPEDLPFERIDDVAFPQEDLGENYILASFNNRIISNYDAELSGSHSDCDESSVGSSSPNYNSLNKLPASFLSSPSHDSHTLNSSSETFSGWSANVKELFVPSEEELSARVHRLELHAYRCTIEALYASGPLSWDQEVLLTDLRLMLHVSDDEHLLELKNLMSSGY